MTIDTSFVDYALKAINDGKNGVGETYPLLTDNEIINGEISKPQFYITNVKMYSGEETR